MAAPARYCPVCGASVPVSAGACSVCVARAGIGQAARKCSYCGGEIPPGSQMCRECGRGLAPVEPPVRTPPRRVAQWPILLVVGVAILAVVVGFRLLLKENARQQLAVEDPYVEVGRVPPPVSEPAEDESKTPSVDAQAPSNLTHSTTPTVEPVDRTSQGVRTEVTRPAAEQAAAQPPSEPVQRTVEETPVQPPHQSAAAPAATPPSEPRPAQRAVQALNPPPAMDSPLPPRETVQEPRAAIAKEGLIIWSGTLQKDQVVTLDGSSANSGSLRGALPGVPVIISIEPRDIAIVEMPGPSNGWKRLALRSRNNRNSVVTIRWSLLQ